LAFQDNFIIFIGKELIIIKTIRIMRTIAEQLNITEFPFTINDSRDNEIYYEDSHGFWSKKEYDSNNNEIYYEDSNGIINDDRPKPRPEYTIEQLQEMLGKEFKIVK